MGELSSKAEIASTMADPFTMVVVIKDAFMFGADLDFDERRLEAQEPS